MSRSELLHIGLARDSRSADAGEAKEVGWQRVAEARRRGSELCRSRGHGWACDGNAEAHRPTCITGIHVRIVFILVVIIATLGSVGGRSNARSLGRISGFTRSIRDGTA